MSLPHAILGILQQQPTSGYDLKTRCFDESIAHFWPADQAQIYRTLDRMSDEGWVESQVEIQQDRPNRKIYSITEAGRVELNRWLRTPQTLPAVREPFLIQVFFARDLPNPTIIGLMQQQLTAHQERLARYHQIPLPGLGDTAADRDLTLQRLTLELGIRIEQAYIDWLHESIEVMRNLS
jgi:DNA-binding PadR family transcriptional regulator